MIKKIVALAGASLMLLSVSGPALAYYSHGGVVKITSSVSSMADTGNNLQGNGISLDKSGVGSIMAGGNNSLTTGAANANSNSNVSANVTVNNNSDWGSLSKVASVRTMVSAGANTGNNGQGNSAMLQNSSAGLVDASGSNTLTTGNATSNANATSTVNVTVNQN